MKKNKDTNNIQTDSSISAVFYLSKFQEFSENVLEREGLGYDFEIDKTLRFIAEILSADAVFLAEIVSDESTGLLKASVDNQSVSRTLDKKQIEILTSLFNDVFKFEADDEGAREAAAYLFDANIPLSGFSVPIKDETGFRGVLAVYYNLNVPATESKILFLKSMASVLSHLQQSRDLLSQVDIKHARLVFDAKREWEGTVDSLEQLIVVLDENAKVIRANKALQYYREVDGLDTVIGSDIETVITSLTGDEITDILPTWSEIWDNLDQYQHIEWISEKSGQQILRFSLRKIDLDPGRNKKHHQGYAVLFVEDITKSKETEHQLKRYATRLEGALQQNDEELERVNELLRIELETQTRTRSALVKSEEKYHTLFNSSLAGICQLDEGCISFHNKRFSEIFKFSADQLKGVRFIELFVKTEREHLLDDVSEVNKHPENKSIRIARAYDAFGKELWLEISFGFITLQEKRSVIVNVIDITRQKNIELSLRESEERLQRLSCELINAQEIERKRLALELHDSLGQSLSAIKYSLETVAGKIDGSAGSDCAKDMARIVQKIRDAIEETRNMSMELRPAMLDDLGIVSTINWFCRQFQETYTHISIEKKIKIEDSEVDESRKIAIFRIIQEAMNNAAKHSSADCICLTLQILDQEYLQLLIADNGAGIKDLDKLSGAYASTGLSGMKERVELTGGRFLLTHNAPSGVKIDIHWPSRSRMLKE